MRWDSFGCFFFFNDTATTEIYTLSLHDALPISKRNPRRDGRGKNEYQRCRHERQDRKSTRLNSSHGSISVVAVSLIGREHVLTPVTVASRMPSSACNNKIEQRR